MYKNVGAGKGEFEKCSFISENSTATDALLVDNVNRAIRRCSELSNIFFGFIPAKVAFSAGDIMAPVANSGSAALKSYGAQKDALTTVLANLTDLGK